MSFSALFFIVLGYWTPLKPADPEFPAQKLHLSMGSGDWQMQLDMQGAGVLTRLPEWGSSGWLPPLPVCLVLCFPLPGSAERVCRATLGHLPAKPGGGNSSSSVPAAPALLRREERALQQERARQWLRFGAGSESGPARRACTQGRWMQTLPRAAASRGWSCSGTGGRAEPGALRSLESPAANPSPK